MIFLRMENFCPACLRKGFKNKIELLQINLEEAVLICKSEECTWPFGYTEFVFVPRIAGKVWSYHWENYKTNISLPKESSPTNLTNHSISFATTDPNERATVQEETTLTSLNGLCLNNDPAVLHKKEKLPDITCNKLPSIEIVTNCTDDNQQSNPAVLHAISNTNTVTVEKQNTATPTVKGTLLTRKNINTGKRYEKFSFSAIKEKMKVQNNDTISDTNKFPDDNPISSNGDDNGKMNISLPVLDGHIDDAVPQIANVKIDGDTQLSTLGSPNENLSDNIDLLLNEFLMTDTVSKDSCDDWLEDLLSTTDT